MGDGYGGTDAEQARRDDLVQRHLGLAQSLASRYANRGETLDDLIQVAMIGLVRAAERFSEDRGIQFSTFATATILGELKHHFRDTRWSIHVPRSVQEAYLRVKEATDGLNQDLGRSPSLTEMAERAGLTEEQVVQALEAGLAFRMASLDAPMEDGTTAADYAAAESTDLDAVEQRHLLGPLVERLPERERRILELRFAMDLTQREIAVLLGMSQMHVSRLLARTLAQLRAWSAERDDSVRSA
ncbi:MAG: polymerase sigma-B factor [Acidimicrobiaceae bacterium]|jgi:RNA polymerase sigma-B factor|nr:polymerase sigma-B factor [Acidimicrobiaceae bacterium]MDQ1444501.1 polymerase sigma-B factor [Acidimicrobiaceae bacterium]